LVDNAVEISAQMSSESEGFQALADTFLNPYEDEGFFSMIGESLLMAGTILRYLITAALTAVSISIMILMCFGRVFEVMVRFVFAPIGLAQLVSGGARGAGMRYIKKFAACCLSGAICVMAIGATAVMQDMANVQMAGVIALMAPITLIGFATKSQRIAEDIVGV
jgi:hypothetical protein